MGFWDRALLYSIDVWRQLGARLRPDGGQTLSEYGLIMTVISVGAVVLGVLLFRDALSDAFNAGASCLDGSC